MFQRLYVGQEARVQTYRKSSKFPIQRGTKQGDPISATIVNVVVELFMDSVKKSWGEKTYGLKVDGYTDDDYLTNLRYVDDILLVARSLPQVKKMLGDVERSS